MFSYEVHCLKKKMRHSEHNNITLIFSILDLLTTTRFELVT
jgi:hypothetical protein